MKKFFFLLSLISFLSSCQTYKFAGDIKLVSFDDKFTKGESVGNIRGESCQTFIFGYPIDPNPTIDVAFENAQKLGKHRIRYINDVSTDTSSFNAGVYAKRCIIVKGKGYK